MDDAKISEIIEMAWCDDTSFDAIEAQTSIPEKEVIKIMRTNMKPSSFRMWRKRVSGRTAKHEYKNKPQAQLAKQHEAQPEKQQGTTS